MKPSSFTIKDNHAFIGRTTRNEVEKKDKEILDMLNSLEKDLVTFVPPDDQEPADFEPDTMKLCRQIFMPTHFRLEFEQLGMLLRLCAGDQNLAEKILPIIKDSGEELLDLPELQNLARSAFSEMVIE